MRHAPASGKVQGTTLVELMVALLIFAAVIVGGFACVRMGLNQVDNARHETRASQIMQSEIERLRSMAWANLSALTGSEQTVSITSEFVAAGYQPYTVKRTVSGAGNIRTITLEVNWEDLAGNSHTKVFATRYAKGGIYDYIQ